MTSDGPAPSGDRSLLLVHGRDFKPQKEAFTDLSMAALRAGIERDCPESLDVYDAMHKSVAWYGDLNAEILEAAGDYYDENLDIGDRRNALASLREITPRKRFAIGLYDRLPGKSAIPEALANFISPFFGSLGLCLPMIRMLSRDFAAYFDRKSDYADKVRRRLRDRLCELMRRGDKIVLVSHGTGSVVAYDVLWQLSHDPDLKEEFGTCKVDLWMTLGSPLGDSQITKRLLGAREKTKAKFPVNVISWYNIAAEDDYTCHDNTLADDFKMMMQQRIVSAVHDYRIFNLAVRYGKSNPHSSIGYYIHPRVSKVLVDWLKAEVEQVTPKYTL